MCEFKLRVKENDELKDLANGIVLGTLEEDALITELNVIAEESAYIEIIKSPIISEFLKFFSQYLKYKQGKMENSDIIDIWEKTSESIMNHIK
ncbi:MAG: hypothetical protein ACTSRP_20290 [Candidatus Helarchaeota archaeon]